MPPAPKTYWFHFKYWGAIIPIAIIASFLYKTILILGIFNEIKDFNTESCEKIIGPKDFMNCEDIILSDEPGVIYASCDPVRSYYNSITGVNKLVPGQPVENGAIWKVDYNQQPADLKKLDMSPLQDYHPLGISLYIDPVSGEKTLLTINLPHNEFPSVEIFTVQQDELVHKRTIRHPELYSPNSIHILQDDRFRSQDGTPSFFFSNDHYYSSPLLKQAETFLFPKTNVMFYNARTDQTQKVIDRLAFSNGVAGTDDVLFVSETSAGKVRQYKINRKTDEQGLPYVSLDFERETRVNGSPDNLHYYPEKEILAIATHPKPIEFFKMTAAPDINKAPKSPSEIDIWDISTGETRMILQDDGSLYGASSTGIIDIKHSKLIVSGVFEEGVLVCDL
ncbi:hypothetical protein RMATCC62417_09321 [Rhizopus microsporus]|nr:hypothetical protein RMATCC62417_09321 [Rhizopus microsporus]